MKNTKKKLKRQEEKIIFSLFELSEKYHCYSFIQSVNDSLSSLCSVRAQTPWIVKKMQYCANYLIKLILNYMKSEKALNSI